MKALLRRLTYGSYSIHWWWLYRRVRWVVDEESKQYGWNLLPSSVIGTEWFLRIPATIRFWLADSYYRSRIFSDLSDSTKGPESSHGD